MFRAGESTQKTDLGLQRSTNEDSSFARAPVFVVADGMGGAQAGEVASGIAVGVFEQGLPDGGTPAERLAECAREANRQIHELSRQSNERAGMGTTLTAVYVGPEELAVAHVGDSRAYLWRDGTLKRLTQDHTLVNALVEQGKLTEQQAAEHPQRSIITRALGPEAYVEVDTWSYPMRAGDVILLCSDGLTSMVSEEVVAGALAGGGKLDEIGERLIAAANAAGGRDNITVVALRVEETGDVASEAKQGPAGHDTIPTPAIRAPVAADYQTVPTPAIRAPVASAEAARRWTVPQPAKPKAAPGAATAVSMRVPGSVTPASAPPTTPPPPPAVAEESAEAATAAMQAVTAPPAGPRPAPAPEPHRQRSRRARLARTQGKPATDGSRREWSWRHGKLAAALLATVIVLALIGAGGWLATRQLYFIGTDSQGIVTIYRGLPYDLPAGIKLYESYYVSAVPAASIPPARRKQILNNDLRSERDASNLVRDLELGKVSK